MKAIYLSLIIVLFIFASCENQDREFEDFGSTSCYFPFQTPARTLILGKYDLGFNENDNNHKFEIGVTMSGVYTNQEDRKVHFKLAPELLSEVANVSVLPDDYYTVETESPVTIPVGSTKGRIKVQLTDKFFDDSLSFASLNKVNYVLPLVITQVEGLDSVLTGIPYFDGASRVKAEEWNIVPKDYTLYGIKFINKYHSMYLRRGKDVMSDAQNETQTTIYSQEYVEDDELVMVTTTGKSSVELSNIVRRGDLPSPGNVKLELKFADDNTCNISSYSDDVYNVNGTGKFVEDGGTWGGKKYGALFLEYSYTDEVNNESHSVKDTLVVRNRNVVFEEFSLEFSN